MARIFVSRRRIVIFRERRAAKLTRAAVRRRAFCARARVRINKLRHAAVVVRAKYADKSVIDGVETQRRVRIRAFARAIFVRYGAPFTCGRVIALARAGVGIERLIVWALWRRIRTDALTGAIYEYALCFWRGAIWLIAALAFDAIGVSCAARAAAAFTVNQSRKTWFVFRTDVYVNATHSFTR